MRKDEQVLKLTKEEKSDAVPLLKKYIEENLDIEKVSDLSTSLFIDFITEKLGRYYYNMGIADAIKYMGERVEDLCLLMKDE